MKAKIKNTMIKAEIMDNGKPPVVEIHGAQIEALYLINRIVQMFSEETGVPVNKVLDDLKSWNDKTFK